MRINKGRSLPRFAPPVLLLSYSPSPKYQPFSAKMARTVAKTANSVTYSKKVECIIRILMYILSKYAKYIINKLYI